MTSWRDRFVYSKTASILVYAPAVWLGRLIQSRAGSTPKWAYSAFRKLFGANVRLFEKFEQQERALRRATPDESRMLDGVLPVIDVDQVVSGLRADGYCELPIVVPDDLCMELTELASAVSCRLVDSTTGELQSHFDPDRPIAIRYDIEEPDLVGSEAVWRLLSDKQLYEVARKYLGAPPVQDMVAMWWSTSVGESESSAAAQMFHFDLDRFSFLKAFVYLTDVTIENGPHVFVAGSQRSTSPGLRRDRRHTDEDVTKSLDGRERTIVGKRGSIFFADTKGLHKGLSLQRGHRLVFQIEYSLGLFGASYRRYGKDDLPPCAREAVAKAPSFLCRFVGA